MKMSDNIYKRMNLKLSILKSQPNFITRCLKNTIICTIILIVHITKKVTKTFQKPKTF